MNRSPRTFKATISVAAVLFILAVSLPCSAVLLPVAQGGADGMIGRDWYSSPNYYWVDTTSTTINVYHDGGNRWLERGLVIIDISSLAGQTIDGASFNFCSNGFSGVNLQYVGGTGPVLTTSYSGIAGTNIASLDGTTGWLSYDVTSFIQSSIDNGHQNAGFVFNAVVNYGGGSLASLESGNGAYLNIVPEPATVCLLALGGLSLIRRKR